MPPALALWLLSSAVSETLRSVAASSWFLPWVRGKTLASVGIARLADMIGFGAERARLRARVRKDDMVRVYEVARGRA